MFSLYNILKYALRQLKLQLKEINFFEIMEICRLDARF